jgi:putative addiction module CopG family antidote
MITSAAGMSTTSIHVTLPKALKEHIEQRVRDGDFTSPSDYVRALVRADQAYQQKRAALLRDIDAGLADIEAGRISEGEEVFAELLRARRHDSSIFVAERIKP